MTHVERIPENDLTAADETALSVLLERCFDVAFSGRSYFKQRYHTRYVVRDGPIVGHAATGLRAIRCDDRIITIAAISDVVTAPSHRGQGIATQMMQALIADAQRGVADFAVLFGTAPLYAALGFVPQANSIRYVAIDDGQTFDVRTEDRPDGLMILPTAEQAWDTSAMLDLMGTRF